MPTIEKVIFDTQLMTGSLLLIAVNAPRQFAKNISNKIEEVSCELKNRKNFDKKYGYIRRSKR